MKLLTTILFFLFSALVFFPALSGPLAQTTDAAPSPDPHQKLFETKCQKCHSLERVKEAHLTRDQVKPTLDRMKSKPGADISPTEADSLYEFLSKYFVIPPPPPGVPAPPAK